MALKPVIGSIFTHIVHYLITNISIFLVCFEYNVVVIEQGYSVILFKTIKCSTLNILDQLHNFSKLSHFTVQLPVSLKSVKMVPDMTLHYHMYLKKLVTYFFLITLNYCQLNMRIVAVISWVWLSQLSYALSHFGPHCYGI